MEKQILVQKAWNYIADKDEDAKIIIDGKIDDASKLIVNFIENLIDNGVLAEILNENSTLPVSDIIQRSKLLIDFFTWLNNYEELKYTEKGIKFYVDEYLKSINCI
jgi:hypothetical protein